MNAPRRKHFEDFWGIVKNEIHGHPVIVDNPYCKWFKKGEATEGQLIDLFEQFAVFSKWFLLAQLMRVLNASDLEAETHARYILANELGVGINPDGSTEEQPFKTRWAHINWLRDTARLGRGGASGRIRICHVRQNRPGYRRRIPGAIRTGAPHLSQAGIHPKSF